MVNLSLHKKSIKDHYVIWHFGLHKKSTLSSMVVLGTMFLHHTHPQAQNGMKKASRNY